MTEKQIKQLQTLLSQSTTETTSTECDERILQASQAQATSNSVTSTSSAAWRHAILRSVNFVRTTTIAVSLTLAIFVGLGQLLTLEQADLVAINGNEAAQNIPHVASADPLDARTKQVINRPRGEFNAVPAQAPSQVQRDTAMLSVVGAHGLPDTSQLLATMTFSVASERSLAQANIDLAMADIRLMVQLGKLNNARERYVQLKQVQLKRHCPPCRLPESLDDLLRNQSPSNAISG